MLVTQDKLLFIIINRKVKLMKKTTMLAIAWIVTAIAVSIAIYITKDSYPLFAMAIPAFAMNIDGEDKEKEEDRGE